MNGHLDVYTLIVVLIIGHGIAILLLLADLWQQRGQLYDWLLVSGRMQQMAAWMMIAQRGQIDDFWSVLIGNTLLITGYMGESLAMVSLKRELTRGWLAVYGLLLFLLLACWWNPWWELSLQLRTVLTLPLMGLYSLIPGCLFLFSRQAATLLQRVIGLLYTLYFGVNLWRAWFIWQLPSYNLFLSAVQFSASFMVLIFLLIVGSLGYILLKREKVTAELEYLAHYDPMTELFNRRAFFQAAAALLQTAEKAHTDIALLMLDIDFFKQINDRYGHPAGDRVIQDMAVILRQLCGAAAVPARFGGEEFCVLLCPGSLPAAQQLAEAIRQAAQQSRPPDLSGLTYTVSIGGVVLPAEKLGTCLFEELLSVSDSMLYQAKEQGRNRGCLALLQ